MSTPSPSPAGRPTNYWASISSLVTSIYFLLLSIVAFWSFSYLNKQEEVTTAEGNDPEIWNNPRFVSVSLASLFLTLSFLSGTLAFLIKYKSDSSPNALKYTWYLSVVCGVFVVSWAVAGGIMSFGTAKDGIEKACKTIDTHCFDDYEKLEWGSIGTEIFGLLFLIWMLASTGIYRSELKKFGTSDDVDDQEKLLDQSTEKSLGRS
ncbi:hypothetical protein JCM5353_002610, partial [Sporobolomyces roseus]